MQALLAPHPHPVDDKMRILDLEVRTPSGGVMSLQLPWDKTAFELEPILMATHGSADRVVTAWAEAGEGALDVIDLPLGKALRSPENPDGAESIRLEVETPGETQAFTITCNSVSEPQPHTAYPRAANRDAQSAVAAFLLGDDSDWFCDGSSTLSCCLAHRDEPLGLAWVTL